MCQRLIALDDGILTDRFFGSETDNVPIREVAHHSDKPQSELGAPDKKNQGILT